MWRITCCFAIPLAAAASTTGDATEPLRDQQLVSCELRPARSIERARSVSSPNLAPATRESLSLIVEEDEHLARRVVVLARDVGPLVLERADGDELDRG